MNFASGSMKNRRNCWGNYSCECDVLPKGTYYIGDPCYAIGNPDDYWSDLCKVMFDEESSNKSAKWNKDKKGKKDLENYGLQIKRTTRFNTANKNHDLQTGKIKEDYHDVAIYGTAYGDGQYTDVLSPNQTEFWVDAGIIGAIPTEVIVKRQTSKRWGSGTRRGNKWSVDGGHFYTFDRDVHCYTDGRFLHFGNSSKHIKIDTDPGRDETNESY